MVKNYPNIFTPLQIGSLKVHNRINMSAMTTLYAGSDGEVTNQLVQYYGARARGGAGMVTVEGAGDRRRYRQHSLYPASDPRVTQAGNACSWCKTGVSEKLHPV